MYKRYINSIIITLLRFKQNFTKPNRQIFTKKTLPVKFKQEKKKKYNNFFY